MDFGKACAAAGVAASARGEEGHEHGEKECLAHARSVRAATAAVGSGRVNDR